VYRNIIDCRKKKQQEKQKKGAARKIKTVQKGIPGRTKLKLSYPPVEGHALSSGEVPIE